MKPKKRNIWSKKLTNRALPSLFEDNFDSSNQLNKSISYSKSLTNYNQAKNSVENIINKFKSIDLLLYRALSKDNLTENDENELYPENNQFSFKNKILCEKENTSDLTGRFFISNVGGKKHSKTEIFKISDNKNLEKYKSEQIDIINNEGKELSEKKEAYKNSITGIQANFYSKKLDEKEFKKIKRLNTFTGEREVHDILENIKENEVGMFTENNFYNKKYKKYKAYNDKYKYDEDDEDYIVISKLKVGKRKYHKKYTGKSATRNIFGFSIPCV